MFSVWRNITESQDLSNITSHWLQQHVYIPGKTIILDIDDTCLYVNKNGIWQRNERIFYIYREALRQNYYIFFITARPYSDQNHKRTLYQLHSHGFTHFNALFLMPINSDNININDVATFKSYTRDQIQDQLGMNIILNIGNAWQDLLPPDIFDVFQPTNLETSFISFQLKHETPTMLHIKLPDETIA